MFLHSCIISILQLLSFVNRNHGLHPNVNPASFCYDNVACDQDTWPGLCQTGLNQSPIDIKLTPFQPYWAPVTKFSLNANYDKEIEHKFYGQNNGHTAQFDLHSDLGALMSNLEIGGGKLGPDTYKFAQLHFHWAQIDSMGSEHQINAQNYPLELHVVHYKSIYGSYSEALRLDNGDNSSVAVMAVFFKISIFKNMYLDPLVQALGKLEDPGELIQFELPLKISGLYPKQMEFARYLGSLTTPSCDEKVIWTVFLRPVGISREQMSAFRRLTNEESLSSFNHRRVQPLHGREISFHKGFFKLDPILTIRNPFALGELISSLLLQFTNLFNYFRPYLLILPI